MTPAPADDVESRVAQAAANDAESGAVQASSTDLSTSAVQTDEDATGVGVSAAGAEVATGDALVTRVERERSGSCRGRNERSCKLLPLCASFFAFALLCVQRESWA